MSGEVRFWVLLWQIGAVCALIFLLFSYVINGENDSAIEITREFSMDVVERSDRCHYCDLRDNGFQLEQPMPPAQSGFYTVDQTLLYVATIPPNVLKDQQQYVLEIPFTMLAYIDVWAGTGEDYEQHRSGMRVAVNDRSIRDNSNVFPLPKTQDDVHIVIAVSTDGPLEFKVMLWSQSDWILHQSLVKVLYGLFFGILLILCVYNIFHAIVLNDSSYYYYVLYLLAHALLIGAHSGLTKLFLWPHIGVLETQIMYLAMAMSTWFGLAFCISFLNIRRKAPKLYYAGLFIIAVNILIALLNLLEIQPGLMMQIYFVFSFVGLIYYTAVPLWFYSRGVLEAHFLILGFFALAFTVAYTTLKNFALVDNSAVIHDLLVVGLLIEILFLSIALSQRIRQMKLDKQKAEQKLSQANTLFTQSLIENQEKDRAELSAYLHDSIGHDLLVMKQRIERKINSDTRELMHNCDQLISNVRSLSSTMHPHVLKNLGLEAAINQLAENAFYRTYVDWAFNFQIQEKKLNDKIQITIYRTTQEAITNILKHANATEVFIVIKQQGKHVVGEIKDDGCGLNLNKTDKKSSGLSIMRGRIELLNGSLHVDSAPEEGFSLTFKIPL